VESNSSMSGERELEVLGKTTNWQWKKPQNK
jgi:hypothetical protein